jgi:hypothetical protein
MNVTLLGTAYALIGILILAALNRAVPLWLWIAAGGLFFGAHVVVPLASGSLKQINLAPRDTIRAFWRRNRDDISRLVLAATLGGIFSALVAYFIKR